LRTENIADRIGEAFLHDDIKFDSHPAFSHRYIVKSEDKDKVRELFSPALLTFLEGLGPDQKWHIEGGGNALVFYRFNKIAASEGIPPLLEETSTLARNFLGRCGLKTQA
jgi:hypothetical protein